MWASPAGTNYTYTALVHKASDKQFKTWTEKHWKLNMCKMHIYIVDYESSNMAATQRSHNDSYKGKVHTLVHKASQLLQTTQRLKIGKMLRKKWTSLISVNEGCWNHNHNINALKTFGVVDKMCQWNKLLVMKQNYQTWQTGLHTGLKTISFNLA